MYIQSKHERYLKFIEKGQRVHNSKYNYSNVIYVNAQTKVKIECPIHGIFEQLPAHHLFGSGCSECGYKIVSDKQRLSSREVLERFSKIHGDNYNYSKIEYINIKTNITIICPIHGEFSQTPESHFNGHGCKKCAYEDNSFRKSLWIRNAKDRKGVFYKIRCFNDTEEFFKYGITFVGVNNRYWCKRAMPYNFEIIKQIQSSNLEKIWNMEKRFFRIFKNKKYIPHIFLMV